MTARGTCSTQLLYSNILNWGDAINPWFFSKLTGARVVPLDLSVRNKMARDGHRVGANIMCMGSVLHHADNNTVIWGTGLPGKISCPRQPKEIRAVRGPLTAAVLQEQDISVPKVYGDPGLLLPRCYHPRISSRRYELGVCLHHDEDIKDPAIRRLALNDRCRVISMRSRSPRLIDTICACRRIVSTSLHGLIVGDAYKIATKWAVGNAKVQGGDYFKFQDYYNAISGHDEEPIHIRDELTTEELIDSCQLREVGVDLDALLRVVPMDHTYS
jgi:pyruvyltransferase